MRVYKRNNIKNLRLDFLKLVNTYRRKLMGTLTKNIGSSQINNTGDFDANNKIKKILIVRSNHRLGNLLLTTPLVQEIVSKFPNCEIDLLAKGNLAPIIFCNYHNVKNYILLPRKPFKEPIKYFRVWYSVRKKTYDLTINAVEKSSSGKLLTKFSRSRYKIFGEEKNNKKGEKDYSLHMAKSPIYHLRNLFNGGFILEDVPNLNLKLTEIEILNGHIILNSLTNNSKKTICIFTYATGNKRYPKDWWIKFYNMLKSNFGNYNIIEILPIENISQIDFKAISYYSKDIREIASVIANTELFIGADSGIMHLATSTGTTTVGLFSVTKECKYSPYGNGSKSINTNNTSIKDIISLLKKKTKSIVSLENHYLDIKYKY